MKLTVLGCGDAFGNGGRSNTSFLLSMDNEHILLDCGATTLVRLKQEGIDIGSITTIIISHFHGDHYGGLPFLLICKMFEQESDKSLTIIGPEGIEEKVRILQEAMYEGTSEQFDQMNLRFIEFNEGIPLMVDDKVIHAYQVEHSPPSNPHAVRLEWEGKVVAFSGDTSWTEALIPLSDKADLFICECNFMTQVAIGHLSYSELIRKKDSFTCKQLWLTHMNDEVFESDAVVLNRLSDGMKITF